MGEIALPISPLNREELLRDSQATLREVAGVLQELWDLQRFEANESLRPDFPSAFPGPGADLERMLENTQREVRALQESVQALRGALPTTQNEARKRGDPQSATTPQPGTARQEDASRALELLAEVQSRLDRLAHSIGSLEVESK
jgi:hypothetical protein